MEAARSRLEVEALQRERDDLEQRVGVAEAQVRSLTSTLSATYSAQQVQSQGSGGKSSSQ